MRFGHVITAGIVAAVLAGCSEKEVILPGKREDLRPAGEEAVSVNQQRSISLPRQSANTTWAQRAGSPVTRTIHPVLSAAPQLAWSASIGKGVGKRSRIVADPVVAQGMIFTVDSEALLSATSVSGQTVWSMNLTPDTDRSAEAFGGGLAYADGKIFVTTGYGRLTAVDAASGQELWEQRLGAVGGGSPTVHRGLVYLVSGSDTGWAVNAETGKVVWQLASLPDVANLQSPAAPAANDRVVVFPFGSGEIQAAFRQGGVRLWDASVRGEKLGQAVNKIGDISGDPVIDGRYVYAANHSGRTVKLDVETGKRLWTAPEGALSPVWPAGGSVFMVTEANELVRLDASNGLRIWGVELPLFTKDRPRRQSRRHAHYGPVLAGGRLVVASSDGLLRFFDPVSGQLVHSTEIPGGATTNPVVAQGVLYLVSGKGQLHAFR